MSGMEYSVLKEKMKDNECGWSDSCLRLSLLMESVDDTESRVGAQKNVFQ
jgi:hypothetical protein